MIRRRPRFSALLVFVCALVTLPAFIPAQMMAHPGWRGNGIANAAWWREAVFARMEPQTVLKAAAEKLDAIAAGGADAIILPVLSEDGAGLTTVNPALGTPEDVDALLREASARRMHVIVSLPYARLQASNGGGDVVRFWLTHGAAGIDTGRVDAGEPATTALRAWRSVIDRFTGQRILIAAGDPPGGAGDPATLRIAAADTAAPAAGRRREVRAVIATETAPAQTEAEQQLRTLPLLLSRGPVILQGTFLSEGSGGAWLRQIFALRRTNAVLQRGSISALDAGVPGVSAWLARPAVPSAAQPAILVLSNASAAPVTLHLQAQVTAMRVRGSFLRALLRNDGAMGSLNLDRITLPPNGAFAGEVRY